MENYLSEGLKVNLNVFFSDKLISELYLDCTTSQTAVVESVPSSIVGTRH